jgi:nicotinamide mononucleotide adenylyltransferase
LLQKALANKNRLKKSESSQKTNEKSNRPIYYASDYSDDECSDVLTAEFVWTNKDKPSTCESLKPVRKNRQEEIKYTFDVAKCDMIFDELLKARKIKETCLL